jgi:hypothetical protein
MVIMVVYWMLSTSYYNSQVAVENNFYNNKIQPQKLTSNPSKT